ncbi:MAG: N-acetyltransferase [Actinobacteria bacterium]|nr:N-acetyltransferase [Actinomycetota bacterium]
MSEPAVVDALDRQRYELHLDGEVAGFVDYRKREDRIVFTHAEVSPEHEGHGHGSRLARFVLDDARRQGLRVVPMCPFIALYVERHPEYQDLL